VCVYYHFIYTYKKKCLKPSKDVEEHMGSSIFVVKSNKVVINLFRREEKLPKIQIKKKKDPFGVD
jgi:hypothetical protein